MGHALKGKSTVVLGASAEGGSGWAIAERFAEEGAHVVVGARRLEGVQALAKKIGGTAVRCDVGREDQVIEMAELAERTYGKIDVAILAGGTPFVGTIDSIDSKDFAESATINFLGPFYFIKHMARHMKDDSAMVLLSTMGSTHPITGYVAQCSAKGGATSLTKYAALEYAARGIRINSLLLGVIESPMNDAMKANKEAWDTLMKEIPLKRAVQPKEVAEVCLWLSLPNVPITGLGIYVDNGNHLRRFPQPEEMPATIYAENAAKGGY